MGQHLTDDEVDGLFREHDLKRKGTLDCDAFRELIFARLSYNVSTYTRKTSLKIANQFLVSH